MGWLITIRFASNNDWIRYGTDDFLGPAMRTGAGTDRLRNELYRQP
jgi:hypothetical protein